MVSDINHIIQRALKGDKNYQEILLKRLTPLIYKNIYTYYEPAHPLVEDLAQEGYMVILESLKDYKENFNAHYLHFIKIRLYYFYKNLSKENYKYSTTSIEDLKEKGRELKREDISLQERLIIKENRETLYKSLNKLSENERKILLFYYFQGLTMKEISLKLNLKYRTVINMKSLALKKLRDML
ncbi:MAG: sigma-70 family RNA polymerase sigma factor [Tissierellia bacterium]|nr:sigma-70 family RNA polymerase sigma factor [Tissierellia bacterium]